MVQEQGRITRHLTLRRAVVSVIFAIVLLLGIGVAVDVLAFDRTTGGTPPDYQDFSGTPIDWDSYERTDVGFVGQGYVLNAHLDCTTGMLSYEVLGIKRDFRELSDRALHVHQPREACVRHGFEPEF